MKLKIIVFWFVVGCLIAFFSQYKFGDESTSQDKNGVSEIYKERRKNPPEKGTRDCEGGSHPPFAYLRLKSRLIRKVSKSCFILPEYKQGMREKEVLLLIRKHISFRLERIPVCSFEDDLFFYFWNDLTPRAGEAVYKETGEVVGWGRKDSEIND